MENFFRLSRDIMKHWVYKDIYAFRVWMHILLRTQYSKEQTQNFFNGTWITQEYGEFVYGRESWSKQLQVPEQRLRTIMKKFEKEGMICNTKKVYPKCSLLSVANYAKFNRQPNQQSNQQNVLQPQSLDGDVNQQSNHTSTGDQPAINRRSTTIKKDNIDKKDKNVVTITEVDAKKPFGEFGNVLLTYGQYEEYCVKYGKIVIDKYINDVDIWFGNNPEICKKRKEHLLTLVQFLKKGNEKEIVIVKPAKKIEPEEGSSIFDIASFIKERGIDNLDEIGKPKCENW
jgi:hypothetical protein